VIRDQFAAGIARVFQHHREQRQIVIGQHQGRNLIGKSDKPGGLRSALGQHRRGQHQADRPVGAEQPDRIGRHRFALGHRLRQRRPQDRFGIQRTAGECSGLGAAGLDVHQHVDRLAKRAGIERLVVVVADRRIGKPRARKLLARRIELIRLEPRDPACDHEIGLEGVDRGPQRLQHIGLDQAGRAEQAGGDPGQKLTFGQPVLNQAGMHVDRARQRDAVDRQFLIVDASGRELVEQRPDQCYQTDDETQPNQNVYSGKVELAMNR
jgi:hypothetical protein